MKEFDKKSNPSREGFSKFLPASMSDSSTRRRLTEYEIQVQDLQAYIRSLEAETVHLRKKLEDAPKDFMILENKLREANRQLVQAFNQNEKLVNALYEAREQITALKEEVDKLCAPPSTYGVYLSLNDDGTINILSQGRKVKVNLHPSLKPEALKPGQELILNEGLNVIEAAGYEIQGEVVVLKEQLDPERAVVTLRADEEKVGIIADPLRSQRLKTGDHILMDAKSGYLLEKLPKSEVEDLTLEEVPDIGYEDIGGLGEQSGHAVEAGVDLLALVEDIGDVHRRLGGGAGQFEHHRQSRLHVGRAQAMDDVALDSGHLVAVGRHGVGVAAEQQSRTGAVGARHQVLPHSLDVEPRHSPQQSLDVVGDVVHIEQQVVLGRDGRGPVHQRDVLDQRDDVARAAFAHRVVQAGEGTDVDHQGPFSASNRFR